MFAVGPFVSDSRVRESGHRRERLQVNRARFLVEVTTAICEEIDPRCVGLQLSSVAPAKGIGQDSQPSPLFNSVLKELAKLLGVHRGVLRPM